MADPASIIGLLAMATTLTKKVLEYTSAVKKVPKELEKLICELTKLHGVVAELASILERGESMVAYPDSSLLLTATGVCPDPFLHKQGHLLMENSARI